MVSKYVFAGLLTLALIGGTVYASQGSATGGLFEGAKHLKDKVTSAAVVKESAQDDKTGSDESDSMRAADSSVAQTDSSVQEERDRSGDDKSTSAENKSEDSEDEYGDDADEDGDDLHSASTGVVTQPAPVATQTSTPASAPKPQGYTMAQVQAANSASKCWSVVSGNVYDLTSWIGQHPGGASAIKAMCGVDATSAFQGQHGGQARPVSELAGFKIGVLL